MLNRNRISAQAGPKHSVASLLSLTMNGSVAIGLILAAILLINLPPAADSSKEIKPVEEFIPDSLDQPMTPVKLTFNLVLYTSRSA